MWHYSWPHQILNWPEIQNLVKQEALWATYLTQQLGAQGKKGGNNYREKMAVEKLQFHRISA